MKIYEIWFPHIGPLRTRVAVQGIQQQIHKAIWSIASHNWLQQALQLKWQMVCVARVNKLCDPIWNLNDWS
jgi:hypothetical protein